MKGLLAPKFKETVLGRAEVRQTYKVSGVGTIAGCYVLDGKIQRNAKARLLRDNVVITETKIDSLRRFKDDANRSRSGLRVRRGPGELQRRQGRRRDRALPDGGSGSVTSRARPVTH